MVALRIFVPYTIESIPVRRKHPKFSRGPDFLVAVPVSILRVLNVWQERKLTNIPPDSASDLDSNSEKLSCEYNFPFSTEVILQIPTPLIYTMRGFCRRTGFVS